MDYIFIQATAWYLQLDIWIVDTGCTEKDPYIRISGNLDDERIPCSGPIITIGSKSNSHYQSLLQIEMFHLEFRREGRKPENAVDLELSKSKETQNQQPVEQVKSSENRKDKQEKYNKQESAEDLALKTTKGMAMNAEDEVCSRPSHQMIKFSFLFTT